MRYVMRRLLVKLLTDTTRAFTAEVAPTLIEDVKPRGLPELIHSRPRIQQRPAASLPEPLQPPATRTTQTGRLDLANIRVQTSREFERPAPIRHRLGARLRPPVRTSPRGSSDALDVPLLG